MFTFAMARSVTVVAAGLMAGLAALSMSAIPEAKAQSQPAVAHAKGEKLPMRVSATACSLRSWPYYDQNCQFDLRRPANAAGEVRLIGLR